MSRRYHIIWTYWYYVYQ